MYKAYVILLNGVFLGTHIVPPGAKVSVPAKLRVFIGDFKTLAEAFDACIHESRHYLAIEGGDCYTEPAIEEVDNV